MAKISFASKLQQTVPAVATTPQAPKTETPTPKETKPTEEPKPATPTAQTHAVAVRPASNQLEGEFSSRDIAFPYLSLGQRTGQLTEEHPHWIGKWIFDKVVCLGDTARVIVCRLSKRYEEDLPFGSEDIPRRYLRAEDARNEGVQVRDVADIDLVIETDKQDLAEFGSFDLGEKSYLPARYTVRSSAYGASVKILLKDLAGWLNGDISSGYYVLGSAKRTGPKGSWYVPALKTDGKVSAELRALIAEKFNN